MTISAAETLHAKRKTKSKSKYFASSRKSEKTKIFRMYVLESLDGKRTYVGVTKDMRHRLRQHNREIKGGAKCTRGREWRVAAIVSGFSSDGAALSVEKSMHNKGKRWKPLQSSKNKEGWRTVIERRLACLRATIETVDPKRFSAGADGLRRATVVFF